METNRLIVKYKDQVLEGLYPKSNNKGFSQYTEKIILGDPDTAFQLKPLYSKKYAIENYREKNNILKNKTFELGNDFYSDELFGSFDFYEQEKAKVFILEAKNNSDLDKIYNILKNSPAVEYVEYDSFFSLPETETDVAAAFSNVSEEYSINALKKINASGCWDVATGEGITIAVLDTGINFSNEDLKGQLWQDEYGNFGRYFFENGGENFDVTDYSGHGTKVSGIIGAKVNNIGISGMAAGSKILTVKLSNDNFLNLARKSSICRGIDYAIQQNARIINMSWRSKLPPEDNAYVAEMIQHAINKGIIVVCCTNNTEGKDVSQYFPANMPEVITVGAICQNNQLWGNRGEGIDIFAMAEGWSSLDFKTNNVIPLKQAASWGPPQVCSLIAMMLQINNSLTGEEILKYIQENAQVITIQDDQQQYPIKLIDVGKTLEFVKKLEKQPLN